MATNKKTNYQSFEILRNASEPYTIHLDGKPYILNKDALNEQVDAKLLRKRDWFYPTIQVISLGNATLKLRLTHNAITQEMTVRMEPDKLHFSCNCGMKVNKIIIYFSCQNIYEHLVFLLVLKNLFGKRMKGFISSAPILNFQIPLKNFSTTRKEKRLR